MSGSTVTLDIPAASLATISASDATEPLNGPITGYAGLCMTVLSTDDNTPVTFQPCDGTQSQHLWLMPDGTIQIYNKCLTAVGTGNRSPVVLLGCDGDSSQQWTQGGSNNSTLTNAASGRCLDDPGFSTAIDTALIIFDCNGGANQNWTWPGGYVSGPLARVIGAVVGAVSGIAAYAVCLAFFAVPTGGFAVTFCSFWWTFSWTLVFGLVVDVLTGTPLNAATWKNLLTGALVAGVGGAVAGYFAAAIGQTIPGILRFLVVRTWKFLGRSAKWLGNWVVTKAKQFSNSIMSSLRRTAADAPIELQPIDVEAGLPTPLSTGEVTAGIASKCADATGATSADLGPDGAPVILNDCAGQTWQMWSDGELTISGSCLTVHDDSTAVGALVELDDCAGNASQDWEESGGALENPVSGLCLDDPDASAEDGTQLRIWTCNGASAQQWTPVSSAVTYPTCDIYAYYGTPCVAAYSMTGRCTPAYDGPLYQVSGPRTARRPDIGLLSAGGYVNAAEQNSFCANTTCTITEIYDQSPDGNNLTIEGPGGNGPAGQARHRQRAADHDRRQQGLRPGHRAGGRVPGRHRPCGDRDQRRSPRACTWWPPAPMSTPAAASTSATPRPTTTTTAPGTWTRSTSPRTAASTAAPCSGSGPWVRGRHGERPVHGVERHEPGQQGQQQRLRHRDAEEQRADQVRAQGRQLAVRRPDRPATTARSQPGTRR